MNAATKDAIRGWLKEARELGATHMIVKCDSWDWSDYPVYVMPGESARERAENGPNSMSKTMECYSMSLSDEEQLAEFRAHHYD